MFSFRSGKCVQRSQYVDVLVEPKAGVINQRTTTVNAGCSFVPI